MSALALEGVTFRYHGAAADALAGVSLAVEPGRLVAVLGPTGAGKTTLTRAIARIVPGFLKGRFAGAVRGAEPREVGLVFEEFEAQLFTTEVTLEVAFGPESYGLPRPEIRRRVRAALARAGLAGFEGRSPATLSGGEKQRLAIAAVLALEPRVFVLDEPTTDLDPAGKADVVRILRDLRAEGHTIVLVEHETEELAGADRVVVLREGRVARDGPAREVLADAAFLEAHGIRPPEIPKLFARLGLDPQTAPVEDDAEAARRLAEAGVEVAPAPDPDEDSSSEKPLCEREPTHGDGPPIVECRGVRHTYEGRDRPALDDVSFAVRPRDFVAILGANGSGKSTLARVLNGLVIPDAGEVRGADPRAVGFVFQNPDHQIFCASAEEEVAFGPRNLGLPRAEVERRVRASLEIVGLAGSERRDPFAMSKSDRQRLAVASVLAMETPVIVMDEPTTGLDHRDQRRMMDLLARLNERGHTVIAITHHIWIALEYARRIALMAGGRIVAFGPVREVIRDAAALERARVRLPPVVRLGLRLGVAAASLDELAGALVRRGGARAG